MSNGSVANAGAAGPRQGHEQEAVARAQFASAKRCVASHVTQPSAKLTAIEMANAVAVPSS